MAGVALGAAIRQVGRLFDEGGTAAIGAATADGPLLGRFLDRGDALAFELLVARHGPMVLATARAVLRDPADAEDAFQATFLALVRKGGSIQGHDALGGWLHRVAHRAAVQANVDAARRRDREREAGAGRLAVDTAPRDEARAAVHDELARLPDRFRLPVVLCHLEGKTHAQAAAELGWGEATVRRRLADARDRLRHRLTRRGLAPSSLVALAPPAATIVPASWVARIAARPAPASASALALATLRALAIARVGGASRAALGLVATLGLALGVARVEGDEPGLPAPALRVAAPAPAPEQAASDGAEVFRGIVQGPDGRPFAGASVGLRVADEFDHDPTADSPTRAVSGPDGRFEFRVPAGAPAKGRRRWRTRSIFAWTDGLGLAWAEVSPFRAPPELSLKLGDDDVPIEGRILDLQGRPVAGAEVIVSGVTVPADGVEAYLAAVRTKPVLLEPLPGAYESWSGRLPGRPAHVRSGADGRFRVVGVGRDRIVDLVVRGTAIAEADMKALTRRLAAPVVGPVTGFLAPGVEVPLTVLGAKFDFAAPPSRPITGVVRDRATGRPLAGIRVRPARWPLFLGVRMNQAIKSPGIPLEPPGPPGQLTDAEGRYLLIGQPKEESYAVAAIPPPGSSYLAGGVELADTPGLGPVVADVELAEGIPFRVRPVDAVTARPVEAKVEYHPLRPNPNVRDLAGKSGLPALSRGARQDDGSYAGVMLPGPGAITVENVEQVYRPAVVDPWTFFRPGEGGRPSTVKLFGDRFGLIVEMGEGEPWLLQTGLTHDVILIDPRPGSGPIDREARLVRSPKLYVMVDGSDGDLLNGAKVWNLDGDPTWSSPASRAYFEATRPDPDRPRKLVFRHDGLKLAGQLLLTPREPSGTRVQLQPWATLSGRLVDAVGKPRPGLRLRPFGEQEGDPAEGTFTEWVQTGPDGRFRIEGLVPGLEHRLAVMVDGGFSDESTVFERVTLKPGESRDLGDVRAESDRQAKAP